MAKANDILQAFLNIGAVESTRQELKSHIRLLNGMVLISIPGVIATVIFLARRPGSQLLLIFAILALFGTVVAPITLNAQRKFMAAVTAVCFFYVLSTVLLALYVQYDIHADNILIVVAGLPFIIIPREEKWHRYGLFFFTMFAYFFIEWFLINKPPTYPIDPNFLHQTRMLYNLSTIVGLSALLYFLQEENQEYLDRIDLKTEQLTQKNQRLVEKTQQLEYFTHIASHDLNEPLRTIMGFMNVLKEEFQDKDNEEVIHHFNFIEGAVQRMQNMISHLLEYSQLGVSEEFNQLETGELLREIRLDLNSLLTRHHAQLEVDDMPTIVGLVLLKQVFQNLIVNGVKFQKPGAIPRIQVSYRQTRRHHEFCVTDNGIGISKSQQARVFRIFSRLHSKSKFEGQGIGLAFCRRIVEVHDGTIWVESEPGQGSRFFFTVSKDLATPELTA